jgi:hypothetical protein
MEKYKVVLKVSMGFKGNNPMITLQDEEGCTLIGAIQYMSIEGLAREYQKDFEYHNSFRPEYYYVLEGQTEEIRLFQRPVIHNYGEPNTYIDETDRK